MEKIIVYSVIGILFFGFFLLMLHHPVVESQYDYLPPLAIESENGCEIIETKEMAYKIAKDVFY